MADRTVKFVFMGDFTLGTEYVHQCETHSVNQLRPFDLLEDFLSDADVLFLNLEGPIYDKALKRRDADLALSNSPEVITFVTKRKAVPVLGLANNHIMDYGDGGLRHTRSVLDERKIAYVGAGSNSYESHKPAIISCNGRRIAFLAYALPTIGTVIAEENKPGCAPLAGIPTILRTISRLKKSTDIICVSLHWGHEFFSYPSPEQAAIARAFADAGATYIIGHHPHALQGIEQYKQSLILYSIGNLFLPPLKSARGRPFVHRQEFKRFMLVKSGINDDKSLDYEIIGGKMNACCALVPHKNGSHKKFLSHVQKLSAPLARADYQDFWNNYRSKRDNQLIREAIFQAIEKASNMPLNALLRTVTIDDVKRNMARLSRFMKIFMRIRTDRG